MYDPQQEDIWEIAIRIAESAEIRQYGGFQNRSVRKRISQREAGFAQARTAIVQALRQAQRESVARRYPLMK